MPYLACVADKWSASGFNMAVALTLGRHPASQVQGPVKGRTQDMITIPASEAASLLEVPAVR